MKKNIVMICMILGVVLLSSAVWYIAESNPGYEKMKSQIVSDDQEEIISDAIYGNKSNLRYDKIIQYCKDKGATVTTAQIDEVVNKIAATNDTTKISDTSFLLTLGLLDMRFNEMLWPATHNSFSNDPDGDAVVSNYLSIDETNDLGVNIVSAGRSVSTENQKLSVKDQLGRGVRMIDVDLGPRMNIDKMILSSLGSLIENAFKKGWEGFTSLFKKGGPKKPTWDWNDVLGDIDVDWNIIESYHRVGFLGRTSLNKINGAIEGFLNEHPNEIAIMRISDLYDGVFGTMDTDDDKFYYVLDKFLDNLKAHGLLSQVYNYYGDDNVAFDKRHEYMLYPGESYHNKSFKEWPTLGQMIMENKRLVIILPSMNKIKGDKSTYIKNTDNASFSNPPTGDDKPYKFAVSRINMSNETAVEMGKTPYRVLKIDPIADDNAAAGSYEAAKQNNNGRRLYDLVKAYNQRFKDNNVKRVVNFIGLDYFVGNSDKGGIHDVDVVDTANRVNYEESGGTWGDDFTVKNGLYWNYFNKSKDIGINAYIKEASTNIDGFKGQDFIDKNVWTGTESKNIQNKHVTVKFTREIMLNKIYLNFFAYNDEVPIEVKIKQGNGEFSLGRYSIRQDRLKDWYEYDLSGTYPASEVTIYFKGDRGIHFKEIAFGGGVSEGNLKTSSIIPTDDSFVKWHNKIQYNYHQNDYNIKNLEFYSGEEDKTVFLKFDMKDYRTPAKDIKRAYLSFNLSDIGSHTNIVYMEDRDATDWKEEELTGNIAKNFDDPRFKKTLELEGNGYVKVEVTDQIKDYIRSADNDNKMTYRMYTDHGDWYVMTSSETDKPPRLEFLYEEKELPKKTVTLIPEHDTFVKWGDFMKYVYGPDGPMEVHESSGRGRYSRTAFLKFGMESLIGKKIISAKLQYHININDGASYIGIREDIDASNWAETRLNGDEAKHFDDYTTILSSRGYDKSKTDSVDVTNVVANFVQRGDVDNKMTFRIYAPWNSHLATIDDRKSSNPPKLIVEYAD